MKGYLCTKLLLRQVPFWRKKEWKFRQLATRCKWINGRGCGWLLRETIKWDEMRFNDRTGIRWTFLDATSGQPYFQEFRSKRAKSPSNKSLVLSERCSCLLRMVEYMNGLPVRNFFFIIYPSSARRRIFTDILRQMARGIILIAYPRNI